MVRVEFVIAGQTLVPDEVDDRRLRAALDQIAHSLRVRLAGVHCEEHGAGPVITATGPRLDDLAFDLSGCCQPLMDRTVEALS